MNSAGVAIERIGQGGRDDGGYVAGVHMAGRGRAERTVEFTARLDRLGRPQQVLHEEVWLDERERQATIHDETFGRAVLPSEGERRSRMGADGRELDEVLQVGLLGSLDESRFPLDQALVDGREQQ